ncbi:hypothetical protein MHYP_G00345900 [Metynnis hypsauchen]
MKIEDFRGSERGTGSRFEDPGLSEALCIYLKTRQRLKTTIIRAVITTELVLCGLFLHPYSFNLRILCCDWPVGHGTARKYQLLANHSAGRPQTTLERRGVRGPIREDLRPITDQKQTGRCDLFSWYTMKVGGCL